MSGFNISGPRKSNNLNNKKKKVSDTDSSSFDAIFDDVLESTEETSQIESIGERLASTLNDIPRKIKEEIDTMYTKIKDIFKSHNL
tara:strand:- start:175 stop:432 length:258 start_codon:yes stop_codon:yes gene_type:complete